MTPKRLLKLIQNKQYVKFYQSKEWRAKRAEILTRDNNECVKCKSKGKVTVGSKDNPLEVHHIKHLNKYPMLALDNNNLVSLCGKCHNKEHPEKLKEYKKPKPKLDVPERW